MVEDALRAFPPYIRRAVQLWNLVNQENRCVRQYFRGNKQIGGGAGQAEVKSGPGKWKDAHDSVLGDVVAGFLIV